MLKIAVKRTIMAIEPGKKKLVRCGIACGQEHLARGPRQLIFVREIVTVTGDFLVGSILSILGDGIGEELPSELRLLQIGRGCRGVGFLESW